MPNKVMIKTVDVQMEIKYNGIELEISDGEKQIGDLFVTRTGLTWCPGRTRRNGGHGVTWTELIKFIDEKKETKSAK